MPDPRTITRRAAVGALCATALGAQAQAEKRMFAVPDVAGDPTALDWNRLPQLAGQPVTVAAGKPVESAYNNHAYLEYFDGRFWAMWSCHPTSGNFHGMHVRYATSRDGLSWSEFLLLSDIPRKQRYVARGFWIREGELLALASLDSGQPKAQPHWGAPDLALIAFVWDGARWRRRGIVLADTINNFPPKRLPNGLWAMARRDHRFNLSLMMGGVKAYDDWRVQEVPNPEGRSFDEPDLLVRPDGSVAMHIRDNDRSKRIYRAVSRDGGGTWSAPRRTNFPDATAKNFNLRLASGLCLLISNPNPRGRVPLTLATSNDGHVYTHLAVIDNEPGGPRIPGHDKGPGYTYPHAIEHDGSVYVIYSRHRDDIVLRRFSSAGLERLPA